jgi:small redox-active disulfide protein 2
MKIQILGTGCPNCQQLAANAEHAAQELGIDYEIEKVTSIDDILSFGLVMTPGLAVDGELKLSGGIASSDEIKKSLV